MRKGTRLIAIILASVMLLTDQSVTVAAEAVSDPQLQNEAEPGTESQTVEEDTALSEPEKESTEPSISNEDNSDDGTYTEKEVKEPEDSEQGSETETEKKEETKSNPAQTAADGTQSQQTPETAEPEERTLKDRETGVRVTGSSDVLPEDAVLHADEKKDRKDAGYPEQAEEDIAARLEEDGFSLTDIVFYDIDLGGIQPSGKVEVGFSVPDDWTGRLDAWYIDDQGKVTNMDGEEDETEKYFTFRTGHFSLYALSVSGPKEKESENESDHTEETQPPEQKKKDEQPADKKTLQKQSAKNGEGDAEGQDFAQAAESYYGENGTKSTASATIQNLGSTKVKTGEQASFLVDYRFDAAASYNYGEYSQPLFDTYDDSKIILHLPEGMSVVEGAAGTLQNVVKVISPTESESENNDWILVLNASIPANSDSTGSFIVNLNIEGNGSTELGHEYDLLNILEIRTAFTIKDRTDPDDIRDGKTYEKAISEPTGLERLTTVTDDKWMVEKTPSTDPYVVSKDKTKVTVRFDLKIGLAQDGTIITNSESYGRPGRVPFAARSEISLTEIPEVLNRSGTAIKAESITVTPNFGDYSTISLTSGEAKNIPVDTCAGKGIHLEVDPDAPYYSTYLVEVVYPYEDFIAQYYYEDQEKLTVKNTVKIQYTLKTNGGGLLETSESKTHQMVGEVTKPAGLTLGKMIVGWDDETSKSYSSANFPKGDPVSGPVTYKITDEDGNPATLYIKEEGKYEELTDADGRVTYDPSEDTSNTSGKVTVYMDPGTYTVAEVKEPENTDPITGGTQNADSKTVTIAAGETGKATFYNKETLGGINIEKLGQREGQTFVLSKAEFGLYSDAGCTNQVAKVTTGSDGTAAFDRLPYGTYYVREITAPKGYIKDDTVTTCEISEEHPTIRVESTNKYNLAPVSMQKKYLNVNNNKEYVNVDVNNYELFKDRFEVQEQETDKSWTTLPAGTGEATRLSLGMDGRLVLSLPVYEEDGITPITYRIVEYLPDGWHAEGETTDDKGQSVVYTDSFTLKNYLGNGEDDPYLITMQNDQYGSIKLTKNFYKASASGMSASTDQSLKASFDLYYQDEKGKLEKFNKAAYEVAAGQTITINDLPRTGENDVSRNYYLVETESPKGYETSGKVTGINGGSWTTQEINDQEVNAFGPFNFNKKIDDTDKIELEQSATISNVEQKVPVVVKKINSYTSLFVPGAKYTVYYYDNNSKGTAVVPDTEISTAAGSLSKLDPGHKYLIEETDTPEGYKNITDLDELVVDLGDITKVEINQEEYVRTIKNQPDPTITVTKQRANASGNNTTLSNVTFEVYTKAENSNTFTRVKGYGGQPLTLTSGKALRLPAGTYWLKEVVPEGNPNGIIDPSAHPELYGDKGRETGSGFFFGPYKVIQQEKAQTFGPVINYSDKGNVTVTKYRMTTDGKKEVLSDAKIGIYKGDQLVEEATSADDTGYASFTGLPIYGADGEKITYTVKEIEAPDGYTASEETFSVKLTPGETVTKDTEGKELELINQPETSLQVNKTYYNRWEYAFTNKPYTLPGAVIALYVKNKDGNYDFVDVQTTNREGNVFFEGLTQKDEYVAIEVRVPDGEEYKYLEPIEKGKVYLDPDYQKKEDLPETIRAENLKKYYYVTKTANESEIPVGAQKQQMVNVENWAQLQIKKFAIETEGDNKDKERLINNAQFTLYMQTVDTDDGVLSFNLDANPDSYTQIGTYSSGTLYNTDGARMDGWFGTDVLKAADNVVYWLVETSAGSGAEIKPENAVTLIRRDGTKYTNNTTWGDEKTPNTNVMQYMDNRVTQGSVENTPQYGPGSDMFSTVRIAKWAGARENTGGKIYKYTPLGNASFELYLADSEGNLYAKLDSMTTGLDNNIGENISPEPTLSAWASSRAFNWKNLTEEYSKSMPEELYKDIFSKDKDGNGYVRVAVVESDSPVGYMMEKSTCYMYMFFKYGGENNTTEIFNDAYYVKGDENSEDKDVLLAEKQDGITWALYPTEEKSDGQYEKVDVEDDAAPGNNVVSSQYRLVNWPIDTWAVTVQKYGYDVQNDNLELNSEELDEYYASGVHTDRTFLSVGMRLEIYDDDGTWRKYAYTSSHADGEFTTDDSGFFAFPEGLPMGFYRIKEVTPASGYENIYDGSEITGGTAGQDAAAYYFQVQNGNVHITMYNPRQLSLSVKKTDMNGIPLADTEFTLTDQKDKANTISDSTDADGQASFENIGTGTYKLTENAVDGYVNSYFSKYFEETYSGNVYNNNNNGSGNLNDLVNGDGIFLGYNTSLEAGRHGTSVQVDKVTDISNYGIKTAQGIVLTVKNPKTISFNIHKSDAYTGVSLKDAEFKVEYLPFAKVSGEIAADSTENWQNKETVITTKDGLATVTGEPGIYRITETKAPAGYDITDAAPRYVAMTGGLNITNVTVDRKQVARDINTDLEFKDDQQVSLQVTKTIHSGRMSVSGNHAFTFTLYDKDKKQPKTLTVNTVNGQNASGSFDGLSQGSTYYLKETDVKAGFAFTGLKDSKGQPLTPNQDGYYEIKMPDTPEKVSVTAENTYLYAQVSIRKVDGEVGTYLDGAEFEVRRVTDSGEEAVSVKVESKGNGLYTAVLPLKGTAEETFRFYETKAPADYLKDTEHYIEVKVSPGTLLGEPGWNDNLYTSGDREQNNQAMLADRLFPNYRGAYVDLVKYDNVHAAKNTAIKQSGAGFTLYQYDEDAKAWKYAGRETTDTEGKIHFVVSGGIKYAVEETTVPDGYQGLENIYNVDEEKADTIDTVIGTETKTLHLINDGQPIHAGVTYSYSAYNIPYLNLKIRKENALDSTKRLTATAAVYEVPAGTTLDSDEAVEQFLNGTPVPLIDNVHVDQEERSGGSVYSVANDQRLNSSIVAGRTYLVVETSANNTSQIRENAKVEWYDVITVPEGSRAEQTAVLKNVEGKVPLTLQKTADRSSFKSLFTEAATVQYTITPQVGSNTYPLTDFTVLDDGLTAYHENEDLPFNETYLKGNYSLNQVTVGQASHDTVDLADNIDGPIYATVTFYDTEDNAVYTSDPMDVSSSSSKAVLPEGSAKAAKVSVSYECTQLKEATGYALGTGFRPGSIQVTAVIDQQTGGEGEKIIDSVRNKAVTTLHYLEWTPEGRKNENPTVVSRTATSDITFGKQEAAKVSVQKKADQTTVQLQQSVEYSITVSNSEDAQASMQEPFLVDYLPQGTSWLPYGDEPEEAVLLEAGNTGITFSHTRSETKNGETAVFIFLNGDLDPGEQVTVKLKVKTENTVVQYGNTMNNYVLAGSDMSGARTDENPQGASFKNASGNWAQSVDAVTTSMDAERRDTLKELLAEQASYGYVSAMTSVNWSGGSDLVLVKAAYGDRNADTGYSTDILSTVDNGGTMHYRLSISNASRLFTITEFALMDILPSVGDYTSGNVARESQWALNFGEVTGVYRKTGSAGTQTIDPENYHIYYYTENLDESEAYDNLYKSVTALGYKDKNSLPEGWTAACPADKTTIRAFVVALNNNEKVQLGNNGTLTVEYTAVVNGGEEWDAERLNENSWTNAVNSFACTYSRIKADEPDPKPAGSVLGSNQVSNTIMPEEVKVGGHIWIDKNNNGIWQEDESISNFQSNYLIQQMLEEVEVRLFTYTGTDNINPSQKLYSPTGNDNWKNDANYQFSGLDPAMLKENVTESQAYPGGILDPAQLKGSAPSTYTLNVTLPNEVIGKYKLTSEGTTNGVSRDPRTIVHDYPKETTDSNFTRMGSAAVSERFYLWATDPEVFDNTKDIGLVPYRTLEIHKTASDDPATKVEGATFTIYGPFASDHTVTKEDLTDDKKIGTYTTDANGNLTVSDLLWYQNYVIVEESTGAGYDLEGAAAAGVNGTNIASVNLGEKPAWILNIPDDSKQTAVDTVNITNDRTETAAELKAEKEFLKNNTAQLLSGGEFTFNLWESLEDMESGRPLMTAVNAADGSVTFAGEALTYDRPGRHVYYITEKREGTNPYKGVTYDQSVYRATVTVEWTGGSGLKTSVAYEKQTGTAAWETASEVKFVNAYNAEGSWTPDVTKTLTGRDMKEGETFTFEVAEKTGQTEKVVLTGTASGGTDGVAVPVSFDSSIGYDLDDVNKEYTYVIREQNGGSTSNGLNYSGAEYEVTVKVTDNGDGTLKAEADYPGSASNVNFENKYIPTPINYTPVVTKTVTGNALPADQTFEFTLAKGTFTPDDGAAMPADTQAQIKVKKGETTGTITGSFGQITFRKAGTYTFTISEEKPVQAGFEKYDDSQWTLTAVVRDDGNGRLTMESASYKKQGVDDGTAAAFTNAYDPADATVQLQAAKIMTSDLASELPHDMSFIFEQSYAGNKPDTVIMPADGDANQVEVTVSGLDTEVKAPAFGEITFTAAGEYTFIIDEIIPDGADREPGVNYDNRFWYAKVTVEDEGGALKASEPVYYLSTAAPDYPSEPVFNNTYKTSTIRFTPGVRKTLEGDPTPAAKTFTFELSAGAGNDSDGFQILDQNDRPVEKGTSTVTYNAGESGTKPGIFNDILFKKAGTYTFMISERKDNASGYLYDTMEQGPWTLTVEIEDAGGALNIKSVSYRDKENKAVTGANARAEFTNSYTVQDTAYIPKVTKKMTGDPRPGDAAFDFTIEQASGNPAGGAVLGADREASVTIGKDMTGVTVPAADTPAAGENAFGAVIFTSAGTYTFIIREKNGGLDGYAYETDPWTLTVKVEDKDSRLTVTETSYTRAGESNSDAAVFTNSYETEDSVPFTPEVIKKVTGEKRPGGSQKFNFTLTPPEGTGYIIAGNDTKASATVIDNASVGDTTDPFGEIIFTKAGTYEFQIAEEPGSVNGYTYDTEPWTLTVEVEDKNSRLVVASHIYTRDGDTDSTEHATVVNTYEVDPTEFTPAVEKTVSGDARPDDATFNFELNAKENGFDPADGALMPEDTKAAVKLAPENTAGATNDPGQDEFGAIRFVHAGTYEFEITETDEGKPGYGYDGSTWILKLTVEDTGGRLHIADDSVQYVKADGTGANGEAAAFENSYSTTLAFYDPRVVKTLTGDRTPVDKTFTFKLARNEAAEEEGTPSDGAVIGNEQITVTGAGTGSFGYITFEKAGTYHFTVSEVPGSDGGYTYDTETWDLEVEVEDTGSFLTVKGHTYSRTDSQGSTEISEDAAEFVNDYQVTPAGYKPSLIKTVVGDVPEGAEAEFRFALTAREDNPEGAVLPKNTEAAVTGSGTADFEEIVFEQAGTYRFDITEINDRLTGYQYDGSVWTLTVNVVDTEGILSVDTAHTGYVREDEAVADVAVFENHYKPGETVYTPKVTKHISGDRTSSGAEFTFILQALGDNPKGAAVADTTAVVKGAGQTAFGPVTFTEAGTYRFDIREVNGKEAGYTYDDHIWRLTVDVEDKEGVLTVSGVKYVKRGSFDNNTECAEFTNKYEAQSTGGTVQTGDRSDAAGALAGLSASALFILILLYQRKRRKETE